ncbi:hypothetical protein ENH_00034510 [Eimeria necatrix]|uniref:Uncharacterized protein n=1 Tax=Eimeria necatrix TaxID=51315 RepID=U6MTH2_9EIME|nr:hypothetical protein ENH_00034510 [Eimeria necatrix]CDJ67316.1 hypothetical protein ENH_00034510 [Eimeria necatrix]
MIRNVIGGYEESGAMLPILPEDGSTVQAFLLRSERRYIQMGLDPHGRSGFFPLDITLHASYLAFTSELWFHIETARFTVQRFSA